MDLQNLQILDNGSGGSLDGDISFTLDATSQQSLTISVSSNMLTVTMNIVSATQIDLEFDYDGNGMVDEVVMTTWQALND